MTFYNKFQGIRYLNGNKVKAQYVNVVPGGTFVTDRDGQISHPNAADPFRNFEKFDSIGTYIQAFPTREQIKIRLENRDSAKMHLAFRLGSGLIVKVWTHSNAPVSDNMALTVEFSNDTADEGKYPTSWKRFPTFPLADGDAFGTNWSWCESSTKPSQLYISDGKHIFYLNYEMKGEPTSVVATIFTLPLPTYKPDADILQDTVNTQVANGAIVCFNNDVEMNIGNIFWYDNKLGCVERDKSTVWLTCTDPAQFYRNVGYSGQGIAGAGEWYSQPATLEQEEGINNLWRSYYASTLSSSWLRFVYPAAGQLYFMNSDNIETWTRSGNEANPLNSTCDSPTQFSTTEAKLVNGDLYLYGKDKANQYQLIRVANEGLQVLTNQAVSEQLDENFHIDSTVLNEKLFIRLYKITKEEGGNASGFSYAVDPMTGYWCLLDDTRHNDFNFVYLGEGVAMTPAGYATLLKQEIVWLDTAKTHPKTRVLIEDFDVFTNRKSFAMVRLQVDTDEYAYIEENKPEIFTDSQFTDIELAVSNDKGNSFPVRVRRKIPKLGNGAENIVWRNVGSGFSKLLRLSYSALRKILLYGIETEAK